MKCAGVRYMCHDREISRMGLITIGDYGYDYNKNKNNYLFRVELLA